MAIMSLRQSLYLLIHFESATEELSGNLLCFSSISTPHATLHYYINIRNVLAHRLFVWLSVHVFCRLSYVFSFSGSMIPLDTHCWSTNGVFPNYTVVGGVTVGLATQD